MGIELKKVVQLLSLPTKKGVKILNIPKCAPCCWISVDNNQYCLNYTLNIVLSNPDAPDHGSLKRQGQEIRTYSSFRNCFDFTFISPLLHHTVTSPVFFSTANN